MSLARVEIPLLRRAISQIEGKLEAMLGDLGPDHCCPSCALGDAYDLPLRKLERMQAWLAVLEAKAGVLGDLAKASANYSDLLERHGMRPKSHAEATR